MRWQGLRTTEFISTGILALVVEGPGAGSSGDRYRDSSTVTLEQRLPRLFRAIELHRLYDEHREEARCQEAADRQRHWESAMANARARYDEQAGWADFVRRARDWREATEQRAFLAAVREAMASSHEPWADELIAHLASVERRLDVSDPLLHPELLVPHLPEPKPEDLRPFLDGWSPHGSGSV